MTAKLILAAADYYNGGNIDGTVIVLRGNGNGTFQAGASYRASAPAIPTQSWQPISTATANLIWRW